MSEQDASSRRLVWIVRLVFYPMVIGLLAIAWHQRHAQADDGGDVARLPVLERMTGTAGGEPATARVVDGRLTDFTLLLHFRCVPDLGDVWATYLRFPAPSEDDDHVRARLQDRETTWANGWYGLSDVAVDGRLEDGRLRGTASGRMALDANGVRADCRAAPVALALDGLEGRDGVTTQGQPVRMAFDDAGRPSQLSTTLLLRCGGTTRSVVWATSLDRSGRAQRTWSARGREEELLAGPGDDGRLGASAARGEDGHVRGALSASVRLDDGTECVLAADGEVAFDVAAS